MIDLTKKYRPHKYDDVVGQDRAVGWLKDQVSGRSFRSALISGPFGTGKTTLGLIYAKAALCSAPRDGEPCDACDNCRAFGEDGRGFMDLQTFECGETSTVEDVTDLLDLARTVPFLSDRRVIIMDEAHNLSRRAFEALLKIFERPPKWTTFVILTSKLEAIPAPLLSRVTHLGLSLLDLGTATDYLADICTKEELAYDRSGLALLHASVGGHARALLRAVEKTATYGAICETNVRFALNLDFLDCIADYCEALLGADFERQVACVDGWPDSASRKLEFLHRFFVFAYFVGVRRMRREDALFQSMPDDVTRTLVIGMMERAKKLGLDADAFWDSAITALATRDGVSDYALPLALNRFNRLVNGAPDGPTKIITPPTDRKLRRLRVLRPEHAPAGNGHYATWKDIRPIWDAASFMAQHYGVLFNLRATIRLSDVAPESHKRGVKIVSDLTHEMGERLRDWNGGGDAVLHWIYRHQPEPDGSFVSRIALAVPSDQLEAACHWARTKFFPRRLCNNRDLEYSFAFCKSTNTKLRARFHWRTVRALSRNLDAAFHERAEDGERRPLVELLEIPLSWRAPIALSHFSRTRGTSDTLGPKAQETATKDMPLISALKDRAWQHLGAGWELLEHADRQAEIVRRRDDERRLASLYPGDDELSEARRVAALAELRNHALLDPQHRLRSWDGWWQAPRAKPRKSV